MGQENYKISQLPEKTSADSTDLMEVSTLVDSSYESKRISIGQLAETAMGTMTYEDLTTTAKTIVGAINELVNSGPSIEVEPLSVTENGTYTAEERKAYSPVTVNVKSEIEHDGSTSVWWDDSYLVPITVDGNPIEINSPLAQNAISTILSYSPKQSGSGDPSPDNIRPIEGWTEANLTDVSDNSKTEYFSGLVNGTYKGIVLNGSETWLLQSINQYGIANFSVNLTSQAIGDNAICNKLERQTTTISNTKTEGFILAAREYFYVRIEATKASTVTELKEWLSNNYLTVIYQLRTPETPSITQQGFMSFLNAFEVNGWWNTISLGGTYYGFTVDVEMGVLRVTHDLGTYTSGWKHAQNGVFYMDDYTIPYGSVAKKASLYTCIKNVVNSTTGALAYPKKICQQYINNFTRWLVYDPDITTESDFNNMISDNPLQIAYELAEPLEIPITPQTVALLAGNNTLWTDGDSLSVTYKGEPVNAPLLGMLGNAILTKNSTVESEPTDEESNISTEEVE